MKTSNDTIGNWTRELPTCSAVPQPTALPRAPDIELACTLLRMRPQLVILFLYIIGRWLSNVVWSHNHILAFISFKPSNHFKFMLDALLHLQYPSYHLFLQCHQDDVYITYLLTYFMEQSPSWEANRSAASQEIPRILWNPKVHHCTHKRTPPVPILSQLHPVHTIILFITYYYNLLFIRFTVITQNWIAIRAQTRLRTLVEKDPLHGTGMTHRPQA